MNNTMNLPIEGKWNCEICGSSRDVLDWGIVYGECFCGICGAPYTTIGNEGALSRPRLIIHEIYLPAAKLGWALYHTNMNNWSQYRWNHLIAKIKELEDAEAK